jgi:Cytochrome P460
MGVSDLRFRHELQPSYAVTMLVLEVRGAAGKGSINQKGNYQETVMGLEVHVKDEAQFPDKWAFFGFDNEKTPKMIPTSADCYSCHSAHAAVDTTFVQFYPTLLPIAKSVQKIIRSPYMTGRKN